jgi:release factor glutamine methyltransferase
MFVIDNQLKTAKNYFSEQLKNLFSSTEINSMWKEIICLRLKWVHSDFILNTTFRLSESDLLFIRSYVHRLKNNEPFQYIHGTTTFFGLELICDKRALIPRPETEELLAWAVEFGPYKTIADLCTGSGCIALGLKSKFSESDITGLDISTDALSLARENSKLTNLVIEFNHADVLNINGDLLNQKWDCIISNPPYIPTHEKESIAENVLNFEPEISLFVENDNPIIFYDAIVKYAKSNLSENGFLFFEIHPDFSVEISDLLNLKGFINIELRKDLQGKNRMIKAQNA